MISSKRHTRTADFFADHPVFSLAEAAAAFPSQRGTRAVVERLRRYVDSGRLLLLERGLYAVVSPGRSAATHQPDLFLAARAARPDAVFCYHSALELLGAAHSVWNQGTVFTERRRPPLKLKGSRIVFLAHPAPLCKSTDTGLGTRKVEQRGFLLRATGPERTLVEGVRRPDLVGGLRELINSATGFATLDLALLERVLQRYNERRLWAAVGWFLEQHQARFYVPADYLERLARHRPRSPLYVPRNQRGGVLSARWNVILPTDVMRSEPDER